VIVTKMKLPPARVTSPFSLTKASVAQRGNVRNFA
jgi:hypothetical protein